MAREQGRPEGILKVRPDFGESRRRDEISDFIEACQVRVKSHVAAWRVTKVLSIRRPLTLIGN